MQGAYFYRIIDRFIDQSGVDTESVFGGQFKDDPGGTALVHDRKGLLSMANMGPNTNTAHFSIMQVRWTPRHGSLTRPAAFRTGLRRSRLPADAASPWHGMFSVFVRRGSARFSESLLVKVRLLALAGSLKCVARPRLRLQAPAPHLNGAYTIFGELVTGWEVAEAINALSRLSGKQDNTAGREEEAIIADSGQIRKGTLEPKLEL